jgi:hypothetical protein
MEDFSQFIAPSPEEMEDRKKIAAMKIAPPITSSAKFENCFKELVIEPGHQNKNCIVKGFTDKITAHTEAKKHLKIEKTNSKFARKEYDEAEAAAAEAHSQYVSVSADAPQEEEEIDAETYILFIKNKNKRLTAEGRAEEAQRVATLFSTKCHH